MRPQQAAYLFPSYDSYDVDDAVCKRYRLSCPPHISGADAPENRAPCPGPAKVWRRMWGFPAQESAPENSPTLELELRCPPLLWVESSPLPNVSIGDVVEQSGDLLTHCFLCKKRIQSDLYMFGHFRTFCSRECRRYQMIFEGIELLDDNKEATGGMRSRNGARS
ncbi:uncharacterized protein [Typha latifolia]|uniref:uncharacterized protein n=1 Tax=Typha latifolia TaxID=4733 RepID=UPI003C2ADFCA